MMFGQGLAATVPVQRRVLSENRCVRAPQRLPRIDAELVSE
jgi:hypothetical protein